VAFPGVLDSWIPLACLSQTILFVSARLISLRLFRRKVSEEEAVTGHPASSHAPVAAKQDVCSLAAACSAGGKTET
jgi:hypothetical protein